MASVFVGDLPSGVTEADLYSKFSQIGAVSSVKLCRDKESGQTLGYGYVMYQDLDDAERAVETFNSHLMNNQHIRVILVGKVNLCQALQGNVFIKNLDRSVDSSMLYRVFSSFGNIITCKVPHGKRGSKCHGFVQFESEAAACAAVTNMNSTMFCGKKLYVGHCVNRVQREPTTELSYSSSCSSSNMRSVYIKNLSPTVDSVFLKITCSPYGDVTNVKIIRDADGSSKGFAFVTFKRVEEAAKAIEMLSGKEVDGRILFAGAAMKKGGRKPQQHQQLHGLQEIAIEESVIPEQQQPSNNKILSEQQQILKKQQQTRIKQQFMQQTDNAKNVQLLPAMLINRQHHLVTPSSTPKQQWQPSFPQTFPRSVQFPTISNCQNQRCEINKLLQLPQIHQQICSLQQQLHHQNNFDQQQKEPEEQLLPLNQVSNLSLKQPDSQKQLDAQKLLDFEKQRLPELHLLKQQEQIIPQPHQNNVPLANSVPQGVNLYVKHLDDDITDAILKDMFSKFGEVISAKVMMEGEKSRGFGFVCFARAEDAARATRDMRRKVDDVNRKPLYVAPAQRKEERQAFFREKLKFRQTDIHSGDVEIGQNLLNPLENIKERQEINCHNHIVLNIPGGDNSNTFGKLKLNNNGCNKVLDSQEKITKLDLSESTNDFCGCHCLKLANGNRSFPKRTTPKLFNFELFNVENLRTPLIKPTRLISSGDDGPPSGQFEMESSQLLLSNSDRETSVTSPISTNIFMCTSPKPSDIIKRSCDLTGIRKTNHNSPWRSIDYEDFSVNLFSRNSTFNQIEDRSKQMTPIGYNLNSSKSRTKNSKDKLRPILPCSVHAVPAGKSPPSFNIIGDCIKCRFSKSSKVSNGDIFFTETAQNIPDWFNYKHEQSNFEPMYDQLSITTFLRNTISSSNQHSSEKTTMENSDFFPQNCIFSNSETAPAGNGNELFQLASRKDCTNNEPCHVVDQTVTQSGQLCENSEQRQTSNLKRQNDKSFDLEVDDIIVVGNHSRPKRRMVSYLSHDLDENTLSQLHNEGLTPFSSPVATAQTTIDLRQIFSWPSEQQKQALAEHIRTRVKKILENTAQPNVSPSESWSQDLCLVIQALVSKEWSLDTISERLSIMLMEMEVAEILNMLQFQEYLIFLVSESLKQLQNFTNTNDDIVSSFGKLEPIKLQKSSLTEPDLKILKS